MISSWTSPGTFNVRATGTDALMFYDIDQTHWANPEQLHENATLYMQARGKGPAERQALPVPPGNMYRDELDMFADSVASRAAIANCRRRMAVRPWPRSMPRSNRRKKQQPQGRH